MASEVLVVFAENNYTQRMVPVSRLLPCLSPSPCTPISSSQWFKDEGE